MTDQPAPDDHQAENGDTTQRNRRRFLAGVGLAGAAALTQTGSVSAADGDPVNAGEDVGSSSPTTITNSGTSTDRSNQAFHGVISDAGNNSHAVQGTTEGEGHAVAGVVNNTTENAVAATWGRHFGPAAATEGQSLAEGVDIAGPANGVRGIVEVPSNGSHAVLGVTNGAGHSVAGDTPATIPDGSDVIDNPNTTAATWGRHGGLGAGIGGVSAKGYGGEFVGGKSSVRLIPGDDVAEGAPTDGAHLVGELFVDGAGELFFNRADGGDWVRLSGPSMQVFPNPQRAFESREEFPVPGNSNAGRFAANETREIDISEFTDIPRHATAAILNLTVTGTDRPGYATVFNGSTPDADRPTASTINWIDGNDTIANGVIVPVSDGTLKVYVHESTDVVIDIAGYVG